MNVPNLIADKPCNVNKRTQFCYRYAALYALVILPVKKDTTKYHLDKGPFSIIILWKTLLASVKKYFTYCEIYFRHELCMLMKLNSIIVLINRRVTYVVLEYDNRKLIFLGMALLNP